MLCVTPRPLYHNPYGSWICPTCVASQRCLVPNWTARSDADQRSLFPVLLHGDAKNETRWVYWTNLKDSLRSLVIKSKAHADAARCDAELVLLLQERDK